MPEFVAINLRIPPTLHGAAVECAKINGTSLTQFIVRATEEAVDRMYQAAVASPADPGEEYEYENRLRFRLGGSDADDQAARLAGQTKMIAELFGANHITSGVMRTVVLAEPDTKAP